MALEQKLIKNISKIFSGLAIVQIINFLFALVLPRIYVPEDFAIFGIFIATTLILFEVVNLRLDQALMIPKNELESIFIYKKSIGIGIGMALIILSMIACLIFFNFITSTYFSLLWIPMSIFLQGILQPTFTYLNRIQQYSWMNISRILQVLVTGVVSCSPLIFSTQKVWLIEGFIAGQVVAILCVLPFIFKNLTTPTNDDSLSLNAYWDFPKYGAISSLLNNLSRNSVVYILTYFFSAHWVGLYTFTHRLVQAPLGMVTSSVGQIFFREASISSSPSQLKTLTQTIEKSLSILASIPVIIALFFGPAIFSFLFGEEWRSAGEVARYLALWYGTSLVVTPLSMLIDVKGRLKWELAYNIIFAICRIGLLIIGGIIGDFKWTMLLFCAISVVFNIYLWIFVRQIIQDEIRTPTSLSR